MQYLPYGGIFVEQKDAGLSVPYLFNAKEYDEESGFYNYGTRYHYPDFGIFISIDGFSDKFAYQSPYVYAKCNPIRYIDVDGLYGDESSALAQRNEAIGSGLNVGELYKSGDEWGFNVINGEDSYSVFETNFFPEISAAQDNSINETSNTVSNLDAAGTTITGIGLNWSQIDRAGNKGTRFRADLFGQKYLRLRGKIGEKMTSVIRVGAPLISGASAFYTLRSDQSTQWKAADLTSTVIGVFGGLPGALISLGYGFGVKPLVRPVTNPTNAEIRSLHEFQNRNSDSNYCRRKRCR